MSLRYIVTFPGNVSYDFIRQFSEQMKDAVDDRAQRDLVISMGGTITRAPLPVPKVPTLVRRARALHR